jgi:integrase
MSNVRIKLTDGLVADAALPPGKSELVLWDSDVPGFGLRLRGGSKTFIVAYRPVGAGRSANMRRVKIGHAAALPSLKEARRLARALLGKVAAGEDPARERADRPERKGTTIAALLDRYGKSLQRRGYVARNAVMSLLRRRLAPLLDRDAGTVTGWQLAEIVEGLEVAGARAAAATFRTRCSTFLNWCAFEARAIEANPLAGYRRGRDTRQERVAKSEIGRALTDDELAAVWRAADATTSFGRLVRFLILTGCRRGVNRAGFAGGSNF